MTSYLVPTSNFFFFSPLQQKYYLQVSRNTKERLEVREIHYFIKLQKKVKEKRNCLFKYTPDYTARKVNCTQIQLKWSVLVSSIFAVFYSMLPSFPLPLYSLFKQT